MRSEMYKKEYGNKPKYIVSKWVENGKKNLAHSLANGNWEWTKLYFSLQSDAILYTLLPILADCALPKMLNAVSVYLTSISFNQMHIYQWNFAR